MLLLRQRPAEPRGERGRAEEDTLERVVFLGGWMFLLRARTACLRDGHS